MEQYFQSEGGEYLFGEVNTHGKFTLAHDLAARLGDPFTHKIDEAIAFGVSCLGEFRQFSRDQDDNRYLFNNALFLGDIVTEIPYESNGRLMVASDSFTLASFKRREGDYYLQSIRINN